MRTTLNIDDELLKEAKIAAIREGITLTAYLERALRHKCEGEAEPERAGRLFPSRAGKPLRDFDWTDTSALLEELEGPLARS